ncbi:MAG: hypothetical protein KatS3mg082_1357 [Nitrospiraceae bacterium]|nr:MAG: hypothetical protein KatS3mg082_1357 [Nitrospiraceae bacterium]
MIWPSGESKYALFNRLRTAIQAVSERRAAEQKGRTRLSRHGGHFEPVLRFQLKKKRGSLLPAR